MPSLPIALSRPCVGGLETQYVLEALQSERLSLGPWMTRFESLMAFHCQTRHAVAVNSGTAALHLIARSLGVGEQDEVVTTPFSFVATSNVFLYERTRIRFVDIDPVTFTLDLEQVERAITPRTSGIAAVDVFGMPADWPDLDHIARRHGLFLVDDACHALGARIEDRPIGSWASAAAFGFYPNKQITTGEGGCVTTDSDEIAAMCRSLRNQGRAADQRMEHVDLGYNYRMNELSAALGCAQLEQLPEILARRHQIAGWYQTALGPLQADLHLPAQREGYRRSWFVYVVRLPDSFEPHARDQLVELLKLRGVESAPYFPSIHLQPYYRKRFGFTPGRFPVCESVSSRTLALPFHTALTEEEVAYVAESLELALPKLPRVKTHTALTA